jgi:hypothetical protein
MTARDVLAVTFDLEPLKTLGGVSVAGVIGRDILTTMPITLDPRAATLTFHDPNALQATACDAAARALSRSDESLRRPRVDRRPHRLAGPGHRRQRRREHVAPTSPASSATRWWTSSASGASLSAWPARRWSGAQSQFTFSALGRHQDAKWLSFPMTSDERAVETTQFIGSAGCLT